MNGPFPGCGTSKSFLPAMLLLAALTAAPAAAGEHSLGLGAHFWKTVDAIGHDVELSGLDDDGNALVASYRYRPGGMVFFQVDFDYFPDGFGGFSGNSYAPMIFLGVGRSWYAAAGVGVTHTEKVLHIGEDEFSSDAYFVGRIGWNLELLPKVAIDLNASYAVGAWNALDQPTIDVTTLAAVLRFTF